MKAVKKKLVPNIIKVETGNARYNIAFFHKENRRHVWGVGQTACYVYMISEERYDVSYIFGFPQGVAFCSTSDEFCFRRGEKAALKDALRRFSFTKRQRKLFWIAFRARWQRVS